MIKILKEKIDMNKKNKKVLNIVLLAISLMTLSGCNDKGEQLFHTIFTEDVKCVEFISGKHSKIVEKRKDIQLIQSIIGQLKVVAISNTNEVHGWKYELKLKNENNELVDEITIYSDYIYYKKQLYKYEDVSNLYVKLEEVYNKLHYGEIIDKKIEEKINMEKSKRETFNLEKVIQGFWLKEDYEHFYFTPNYIVQGDYKFKYKIKEIGADYLVLSVFKESIFFSNEQMIFQLHLEIDDTRNNMLLTKTVQQLGTSPHIYEYKGVYINDDNYILGSFNSDFFVKMSN